MAEENLKVGTRKAARDVPVHDARSRADDNVKRTVPWLASVAIHAGIFLIALLVAGTVRLIQQDTEPPTIMASFDALIYDPVTRMDLPPAEVTQPDRQDRVPLDSLERALEEELRELVLDPLPTIDGAFESPSLSQFQPSAVEGSASFVGLTTTNARRIVYVIDASGSLIASLQVVIRELSRSLRELTAKQSFSIVFFQQDRALAVPPGDRLLQATSEEKRRALEWIDRNIIPNGNSNPLPALRKAIRLQPDVIFLLSDNITGAGQYEIDQEELLAELERLNPRDPRSGRRSVQINCIQFLDPDPLQTLPRIASAHGGPNGFKFLDRRELGLARKTLE